MGGTHLHDRNILPKCSLWSLLQKKNHSPHANSLVARPNLIKIFPRYGSHGNWGELVTMRMAMGLIMLTTSSTPIKYTCNQSGKIFWPGETPSRKYLVSVAIWFDLSCSLWCKPVQTKSPSSNGGWRGNYTGVVRWQRDCVFVVDSHCNMSICQHVRWGKQLPYFPNPLPTTNLLSV